MGITLSNKSQRHPERGKPYHVPPEMGTEKDGIPIPGAHILQNNWLMLLKKYQCPERRRKAKSLFQT